MEHYQALFEPDRKAGGYVVTFPDFGYGVTQGETDEDATAMAQDLLMLTIGDYIREGKPLPLPSYRRGQVPTRTAAGFAIRQSGLVPGVSKIRVEEGGVCPAYWDTKDAR